MPESRKPLLTPEEVAFLGKDNGFQPHPAAAPPEPVPVEAEPAAPAVEETEGGGSKWRSLPKRANDEATVRFTVDLRHSQHKRLKMAATEAEMPMTALLRHIISDWLDANEVK